MTRRQQKRYKKLKGKKVNKPPIKEVEDKERKQHLTRLSSIMKGVIVYKKETAELERLFKKYDVQCTLIG